MKSTGMVRRIDDSGKINVPMEIRKALHLRPGDPLEIYISGDDEVIYKKYSPIGEGFAFAAQYAESLYSTCALSVVICDRDSVIAFAGVSENEYYCQFVSEEIKEVMESKKLYVYRKGEQKISPLGSGCGHYVSSAMPIVDDGNVVGCVMALCEKDKDPSPDAAECKLIQTAAEFIGKTIAI